MLVHHDRLAPAGVLAGLVLLCAGCAEQTEATVRQSYTVRGQVVGVPSPDRPIDELRIRHEAIPNYADREGNVYVNSKGERGMGSMSMPFPVGEGVSLEGIEPGDLVEFTFVVEWGEENYPVYHVSSIKELPPDTTLDFGAGQSGG